MTDTKRRISRIDIIGQNGNDGAVYEPAATAYINRQTARRLVEGVARELEREAMDSGKLGQVVASGVAKRRADALRDALALMLGDGGYPFEPDAGEIE